MDERTLKARALAYLAQREHSRGELRRKLLASARSHASQCGDAVANGAEVVAHVGTVLDWLEANGHLSEQRFVESRVHVRGGRFGTLRIRQELAQHGLTLPPQTEATLLSSEFDRACAIWLRKFGRNAGTSFPTDQHTHAEHQLKQARFLAGRGFSGDIIRRVLRAGLAGDIGSEPEPATADGVPRNARATLPR